MVSASELIDKCKLRWNVNNQDERIKTFEENLPAFLENFEGESLEVILCLLDKFDYYSHREINSRLIDLHHKVIEIEGFDIEKTVFCVLKTKSGKMNSSTEYVCEYGRLNGINKYSIIANIDDIEEAAWEFIDRIVFIDDCCGSGQTFSDMLLSHLHVIKGKKIVYAVVHIMSDAIERIEKSIQENQLGVIYTYCRISEKAFDNEELSLKRTIFEEASKKVGVVNRENDIYGYKKTEMLISYYNNTPNNTIGVFRKDTEFNKSIFPRRNDKKPGWLKELQESKKKRKEMNYSRKVKDIHGRIC